MKKIFLLTGMFLVVGNLLCVEPMDRDHMLAFAAKIAKPRPLSIYEYDYNIIDFQNEPGTHFFGVAEKFFGDERKHIFTVDDNKIVDSDYCINDLLKLSHLNYYRGTMINLGWDSDNKTLMVFDVSGKIEKRE